MSPLLPNYPPVLILGDWQLFQLPRAEYGSPLWIEFKLINPKAPKKWGQHRVYRFAWGVDEQRLRRDRGGAALAQVPSLLEPVEHFLRATYTLARTEARLGGPAALAAERARLQALRTQTGERRRALRRIFS